MDAIALILAATEAPAEGGGSFLVSPSLGLMIWTLLSFGVALLLLRRLAFPQLAAFLDRRRQAIADEIEESERLRAESDKVLAEYRSRLAEAREQAEDIVVRARKAGETTEEQARNEAKAYREQLLETTRKDIESETRRALDEIRKEVANLTITATEKVTRKTLDSDDHRRLIEDALSEVDFTALAGPAADGGER
ncbi:MAG: F0F1 ATP synthase subunit B [Thermoleophilaceae bacterium]|nr:F0F1 ATP synthase subunit B [Thermoleophilaceae bacterium]